MFYLKRYVRTRRLLTGEKGWLGLVLYIIAVDTLAWRNQATGRVDETMSVSWGRWVQVPRSRMVTGAAWALITAHLFLDTPIPGRNAIKKIVVRKIERKQDGEILVIQVIQPEG